MIVASPSYLERAGTPRTPADLARHNCLALSYVRAVNGGPFVRRGRRTVFTPQGNTQISNVEALRAVAIAGLGLARLAEFRVRADLDGGRLVPVVEDFDSAEIEASIPSTWGVARVCRHVCWRFTIFWLRT